MEDPFSLALAVAAIIVIYAIIRGVFWLIWPRKIAPHEYESSDTWGSHDQDSRREGTRR